MILRVRAMYEGSRIVLGVLLLLYVPMIFLVAISTGIYNNPTTYLSGVCRPIYCRNCPHASHSEQYSSVRCLFLQRFILLTSVSLICGHSSIRSFRPHVYLRPRKIL